MKNDQKRQAYENLADAIQVVLDGSEYPRGSVASDFVVVVATSRVEDGDIVPGLQILSRGGDQAPHRTVGLLAIAGEAFEVQRED